MPYLCRQQFHERYSLPVQQLSTLHLCHYLEVSVFASGTKETRVYKLTWSVFRQGRSRQNTIGAAARHALIIVLS